MRSRGLHTISDLRKTLIRQSGRRLIANVAAIATVKSVVHKGRTISRRVIFPAYALTGSKITAMDDSNNITEEFTRFYRINKNGRWHRKSPRGSYEEMKSKP